MPFALYTHLRTMALSTTAVYVQTANQTWKQTMIEEDNAFRPLS